MNAPIPLKSIAQGVPPAAVLRILAQHSREELAAFIAVAIDLLDLADGDPDDEEDDPAEDDDPAGQCDEDGINTGFSALSIHDGPGCEISDGDSEHDGREHEEGI